MSTPATPTSPQRSRRWFAGAAALGSLGLVAAGQAQAFGHGMGRGMGGNPEEMARKLDYRIGYLIKEINGTPQQKDQLVAIAKSAMADLKPLREQHMQARKQGMALLAAAAIDRNALEQLRLSQMKLADASSARLLQAMTAAAEVFTPAQRAEMATKMQERMARRQRG